MVLATRDRCTMLSEALSAVTGAIRPIDEVVVVDSASRDAQSVARTATAAGARLVRCDQPGLSRARNAGWRASYTQLIAFTDDDCLPGAEWTAKIASAFEGSSAPDFVTGRVLSDSSSTASARLALSVTSSELPAVFSSKDDPLTMGHGANMAFRRSALEKIGGFDELLGAGAPMRSAEDTDAFWRILTTGGRGCFDPQLVVVHRQWRGLGDQLRACFGYGVGTGALAAKRWRLDEPGDPGGVLRWRSTVRRGAKELVWRRSVRAVARNVAIGYQTGILAELSMLAGSIDGLLGARHRPLKDGQFSGSSAS